MSPEIQFHCRFLDRIDAITCNFQGPYKWGSNRPSLAKIEKRGEMSFLRCDSALYIQAEVKAELCESVFEETQRKRYTRLVKEQSTCSKFEESFI